MIIFNRFKNRLIASILTRFPSLANRVAQGIDPMKFDSTPWAPVAKPLAQMTIAIVTTAGVHLRTDAPFDMNNKSGDGSLRVIDSGSLMGDLSITHDYYDHTDADRDVNIVFPLDRLRELVTSGVVGAVAKRHYGFMGHIENEQIEKLIRQSAPQVAHMLKEDGVDGVLVAPGWGLCNRSGGLIQRVLEAEGIPTVGVSIVRKFTEEVKPPRSVFVKWPFGHPFGEPGAVNQQKTVLLDALRLLTTATQPGVIVDLPYRWKREKYDGLDSASGGHDV